MNLIPMRSALSCIRKWLGGESRMCLNTSQTASPTPLIESGWKQFDGGGTSLSFSVQKLRGRHTVPLDKWLKADTGQQLRSGTGATYPSGFHIYADEMKSGGRRVYYRQAHAKGRQDAHPCVIAAEMYVPSDPEGWPPLD